MTAWLKAFDRHLLKKYITMLFVPHFTWKGNCSNLPCEAPPLRTSIYLSTEKLCWSSRVVNNSAVSIVVQRFLNTDLFECAHNLSLFSWQQWQRSIDTLTERNILGNGLMMVNDRAKGRWRFQTEQNTLGHLKMVSVQVLAWWSFQMDQGERCFRFVVVFTRHHWWHSSKKPILRVFCSNF